MAKYTPQSIARLLELEADFEQFPGRRPGGSGPTGIGKVSAIGHAPNGGMLSKQTAKDYDRMVSDQMEYEQLMNSSPMKIRHDMRPQSSALESLLGESYTGPVNPMWTDQRGSVNALRQYTGTGDYYQSHDQFKKRYER